MRTTGSIFLCIGFASLIGCGSDTTVNQTANGVFPANGFAGRTLRVEVSGDQTNWSSSTTVDFGAGTTVANVEVASPTDLFADVTIDGTAATGKNDVTVTDGGKTFTLAAAFEIDTPAEATFTGTPSQGSIVSFTIKNHDVANPFDTTATQDPFTGALTFTNLAVDAGAGTLVIIEAADPFSVSGLMAIDVDAGAGGPVTVTSGPAGGDTVDFAGGNVTIAARTPKTITAGTPATGNIANAFDSDLLQFDAAAASEFTMDLTTNDNAAPQLFLLPSSGHFSDLLVEDVTTSQLLETGATFYVVISDLSGSAPYAYSLDTTTLQLTSVAANDTGDLPANAQAITAPALVTGGDLSSATDQDWFKITVTQADVGKSIHVVTAAGDPQTDTFVDIFGPNSSTTNIAEGDDSNFHENVLSPALTAAGTYFVEISASPFFDPSQSHYIAAITLE